jgi:hypothetical protein
MAKRFLTFSFVALMSAPLFAQVRSDSKGFPAVAVSELADVWVSVAPFPTIGDPSDEVVWRVTIGNLGDTPARDLAAILSLPAGSGPPRIDAPGWSCVSEAPIRCTRATEAARSSSFITIVALLPGGDLGGPARFEASMQAAIDDDLSNNRAAAVVDVRRLFRVTTVGDGPEGSLRAAIERSNAECAAIPCKIGFDLLPPAPGGWVTIRPISALPPVTSSVIIDGAWHHKRSGEWNPLGPDIEIDGSVAGETDGLTLAGCTPVLHALAINRFRGNGVFLLPQGESCSGFRDLTNSYIGTDPTGQLPAPNHLRGVAMHDGWRAMFSASENVVSGNRLSGLYFRSGWSIVLGGNRIGVAAHTDEPLPNGASGVYFGPGVALAFAGGNTIASNLHWGIAIGRGAALVELRANSIRANIGPGIDYGHDYATPNDPDDDIPDFPLLLSAAFDRATGVTRIRGTLPESGAILHDSGDRIVEFFANAVAAREGSLFLGSVRVRRGAAFEFEHAGDLRRFLITATSSEVNWGFHSSTSEFSAPVLVTE